MICARWILACFALLCATGVACAGQGNSDAVSFRRDIAPILLKQCQSCHGPEKSKGKYRLDTFERLLHPGKSKDATIVAGKPDQSALFQRITSHDEDERMPQKADSLPASQVELIRRWIDQGAKFDGPDRSAPLASLAPEPQEPAAPEAYREPVPITALAFSPDGKELAASGYHEITIWDATDGRLLGRIGKLPERTWGLSWSPDGKLLAAACGTPGIRGEVRLCDPIDRTAGKALDRIADMMLAVRFSPDGTRLAAGGADNALRVYDTESGRRELLVEQHADWITDLAWSPDGSRIATASRDKSARVFDAKTGAMEAAYLGHEEPVYGIAFSDDGKIVFTAGRDRKIHAWNAADAKRVGEITVSEGDPLKLLAFDGTLLNCATGGSVRAYSQDGRRQIRAFTGNSDWVYCLALEPSRHRLAGGCYDGHVEVWDTESGQVVHTFLAAPGLGAPASAPATSETDATHRLP